MLCLTRKIQESVAIDGGRILVTVLSIDRGKIRLGFTAPRDVRIDRKEIHDERQAETRPALAAV